MSVDRKYGQAVVRGRHIALMTSQPGLILAGVARLVHDVYTRVAGRRLDEIVSGNRETRLIWAEVLPAILRMLV